MLYTKQYNSTSTYLFSAVLFEKIEHATRIGQPQSQHVTIILMLLQPQSQDITIILMLLQPQSQHVTIILMLLQPHSQHVTIILMLLQPHSQDITINLMLLHSDKQSLLQSFCSYHINFIMLIINHANKDKVFSCSLE